MDDNKILFCFVILVINFIFIVLFLGPYSSNVVGNNQQFQDDHMIIIFFIIFLLEVLCLSTYIIRGKNDE